MYKLLVVDDEIITVQGISRTINWHDCGISQVYEAYDIEQARQICIQEKIDLVITDIEMPGGSGLELIAWINKHYPNTKTIIVSGHDNFHYVKQALQFSSFDYILKPADHEELKLTAIQALAQFREEEDFASQYEKYQQLWYMQRPLLIEKFWQDLFSERSFPSAQRLSSITSSYNIPLDSDGKIKMILLSVEKWGREFNTYEEEIMTFAVRKAAAEIILDGNISGDVVEDREGTIFLIIYGTEAGYALDQCDLQQRCKEYLSACEQYFYCEISCYIDDWIALKEVIGSYRKLIQNERRHITSIKSVIFVNETETAENVILPLPWLIDWLVLIETCQKEELNRRIDHLFEELRQKNAVSSDTLEAYHHGVLYMVHYVFHKNGRNISEVHSAFEDKGQTRITKSLESLQTWMNDFLFACVDILSKEIIAKSSIINRVIGYIDLNYGDFDLTREQIAKFVHLNPSYISKIFKKETGKSLTDYILQVRVNKAMDKLVQTNEKVGAIAESVGYTHYSHFTKLFKKQVGLTPQEYRKKYHQIH